MSAGLETSLETLPETSKALKHRREAAACGVFAVNAKRRIANCCCACSGRCSRARTTKTGLMGCRPPHRRDAIRLPYLHVPDRQVPRRRAFFGGLATWRNIRGIGHGWI